MPQWNYNSSNEVTSNSAATFSYDNNGNTVSKALSSGTTQYAWDFENRLSSAVLPSNGGTVAFKYDPFGRRIQKAFTQGTTTTTTNYVYDGANSVEEVDQGGNVLARYTQGAGIDEPLSEVRSGAASYYEQDGLGSVTSLSGSSGSLANTYVYDGFGNLAASTGNLVNAYQYTGRDYDSETGLRYYRARYYDSNVGRFVSEDPVHFGGGVNFYDYVNNRVTGFVDPMGLSGSKPGGPYHPPVGVHTKCLPTDDCSTLAGKMWILTRMINSHQGWDRNVPRPRGGNRHAPEIAQLWVQYAECYDLYLQKCQTSCPRPGSQPAPQPANQPNTHPFTIPIIDPLAGWLRDRLGELGDAIRRGPPTQPTPWGPVPVGPPIPVFP